MIGVENAISNNIMRDRILKLDDAGQSLLGLNPKVRVNYELNLDGS